MESWKNEEFESEELKNKIIKFIEIGFDPNNQDYKEYAGNPIESRKKAAIMAGFERNDKGLLEPFVIDFINAGNEQVNRMIGQYLINKKNYLWTCLMVHENLFIETCTVIMSPSEIEKEEDKDVLANQDKKKKLATNILEIQKTIETLQKDFFGDDEDVIIKGIRPENAVKIQK